jgi:hypothetical protein
MICTVQLNADLFTQSNGIHEKYPRRGFERRGCGHLGLAPAAAIEPMIDPLEMSGI